jgi:S-adenosylmethionine/arginine decarboxylase-like enzyme
MVKTTRKVRKSRKIRKGRESQNYSKIQHNHLLLRMETKQCPGPADKSAAGALLHNIVKDIDMAPLDKPRVYYVSVPRYNEGLTAFMPIETSHIAFHFWKKPEPAILSSKNSKCLLEFDIYTCGSLSSTQIQTVLDRLSIFGPTRVDATVVNRKLSMAIDKHMHWSEDDGVMWGHWLRSIV